MELLSVYEDIYWIGSTELDSIDIFNESNTKITSENLCRAFLITSLQDVEQMLADLEISNTNARSSTGVLASHPQSRDIKVEQVTLNFYGGELLADTKLELTFGHKYARMV